MGATLGLDLAELLDDVVELAREALAVHAEGVEGLDLFAERMDDDERGVNLGMFGDNFVFVLCKSESDQVIFERGNAIHAPRGVGERLYELVFEHTLRLELNEEFPRERVVGIQVLDGQDDGVAGEAVTVGVEGGAFLARLCFRSGGMGRVGAIARCAGLVRIHSNWVA